MRDKRGRFIKGHKVIGGFKKGHVCLTPELSEEHKRKIGLACKGRISSMKNRKMPLSAKRAISKARKGKPLEKIRGKNHPNWKGGRTKLQAVIRSLIEYSNWRTTIFKRDNYTCVICGAKSGAGKRQIINADHYPIAFSELLSIYMIHTREQALKCEALWDILNGRTLCFKCHKKRAKFWRNQYGTKKSSYQS